MSPAWAQRPRLIPYLIGLTLGLVAWSAFILIGSYQYWRQTGQEVIGMRDTWQNGLLAVLGVAALVFAGHWIVRARQASATHAATAATQVAPTAPQDAAETAMLAGTGERYVLEVRALGLAVDRYHQTLWQRIKRFNDNYASVLSQDAKDYPDGSDARSIDFGIAYGSAFKYGASDAIGYWPMPTFIIGPPKSKTSDSSSGWIIEGRNDATLGVTLFLTQEATNAASAQGMLHDLFAFFDAHPDVPEALVFSMDGTFARHIAFDTAGTPTPPPGSYVPPVPDSMVALLVTRSDRVDRLVRPYANADVPGDIDKNKTQYDVVKLWNFYWKQAEAYDPISEAAAAAAGVQYPDGDGIPASPWWIEQLPELWKSIGNKGPGEFKPSPYLPVRWTGWQLKEFDSAPVLGYLHRPVAITLTDEHGQPLPRNAQVKALRAGWDKSMATLPQGEQPVRVFYDTSLDREWLISLTQALHDNPQGLSLGDVKQGYDIGHRVGNTGVSSAMVQIGLGVMAGYFDGGTSATVNLAPDGQASIIMVSPPAAATKAANAKRRGSNPFVYYVPGMGKMQ